MIKSYTLDCGCYFEHKPQPGVDAYQLIDACVNHDALSSQPPLHELPPVAFLNNMLAKRQAPNGPVSPDKISTLGDLLGDPLDDRGTIASLAGVDPFTPEVLARIEREAFGYANDPIERTQPISMVLRVAPAGDIGGVLAQLQSDIRWLKDRVRLLDDRQPPFPHEG